MALSSNALTTVATLAGELGIATPASGSTAEADLERRIAVASGAIENYCNRKFAKATKAERVRAYGTPVLLVSLTPVLSITSVSLYAQDGSTEEVDAEYYEATTEEKERGAIRYKGSTWDNTALLMSSPAPEYLAGTEEPLYEVVYVGGYVLPKDATELSPRTLPYELEEACLLACVASYRAKGRDTSLAAETLLSASRTYREPEVAMGATSGLPVAVEAMLAPFRRWA